MITLTSGVVRTRLRSCILNEILAFDMAEFLGHLRQANAIVVSSSAGPECTIWGYDAARDQALDAQAAVLTVERHDGKMIPVKPLQPLVQAGDALLQGYPLLAAVGWLQYLADRNPPGRPSIQPGRSRRPAGRDRVPDRRRCPAGQADDDPPRWLTLAMTVGVTAAPAAWGFSTGFTAIILAVAVDMMAATVNACKTYRHPAGEFRLSWWLFLAATIAALLAVGHAAPILYAYPGAGALTALAVITAWATGRADLRSHRLAGS